MLIITLRTDKPEAELGLYDGDQQLAYETWLAHRVLAETIHGKIKSLLQGAHKDLHDIKGIAVFKGPGSFTGLRIGITIANALAASLGAAIVATEDPDWLEHGVTRLLKGENEQIVVPEYGAAPHITPQKK